MVAATDVTSWTARQVAEWVDGIGLGPLKDGFLKNAGEFMDIMALENI